MKFLYLPRLVILSLLVLFSSCKNENKDTDEMEMNKVATSAEDSTEDKPYTITTRSMEFNLPKDTIDSGWTRIRYENNSNETHFVIFEKYPEGKGLKNAQDSVVPVFQDGMDLISENKMDEAMEEFGKLPEWFGEIVFSGGTGLISPQSVAESTIYLEPGNYIIECYVKMPNGRFHSTEGMLEDIYVTGENSDLQEPKADYEVSIDSENGITMEATPTAGEKVFKVDFNDQKQHEHFLGHDVHLVRVESGSDLEKLSKWMVWSDPEGFTTPAPAGFKFVGGMQEMPAGKFGYFKADLKPGNYVLVAEVPGSMEKGMLKEFTVK